MSEYFFLHILHILRLETISRQYSHSLLLVMLAQTLACGIKTYRPGGMIDFQNIETGSPYMSGTIRNKIYVGKHSR